MTADSLWARGGWAVLPRKNIWRYFSRDMSSARPRAGPSRGIHRARQRTVRRPDMRGWTGHAAPSALRSPSTIIGRAAVHVTATNSLSVVCQSAVVSEAARRCGRPSPDTAGPPLVPSEPRPAATSLRASSRSFPLPPTDTHPRPSRLSTLDLAIRSPRPSPHTAETPAPRGETLAPSSLRGSPVQDPRPVANGVAASSRSSGGSGSRSSWVTLAAPWPAHAPRQSVRVSPHPNYDHVLSVRATACSPPFLRTSPVRSYMLSYREVYAGQVGPPAAGISRPLHRAQQQQHRVVRERISPTAGSPPRRCRHEPPALRAHCSRRRSMFRFLLQLEVRECRSASARPARRSALVTL